MSNYVHKRKKMSYCLRVIPDIKFAGVNAFVSSNPNYIKRLFR